MNVSRKPKITLLVGLFVVEAGSEFSIPGVCSLVTMAEARVRRPLTPVSVAGVARRSARRCSRS